MATTRLINGRVHPEALVMQGAHVQMGCTIGARTRVWQFASVIRKAIIGEDCRIAAGACVDGSQIGNKTIISPCAFIAPGMWIGDEVFIGPFVGLCNDAWPRAGKDGFDVEPMINGDFTTTRIHGGASICMGAVILPGITIGACAMVAANAVVVRDVPDFTLYHRDGTMVPIDLNKRPTRMREANDYS